MLLHSMAIVAKKLLVHEEITAWVFYVSFQIEKHCLVKHFAFLKNVLLTIFKCCALSKLVISFLQATDSCQSLISQNEINNMDQNQPITTYRHDLLNLPKETCVSWEVR